MSFEKMYAQMEKAEQGMLEAVAKRRASVDHPQHYKHGGIETIDIIEAKGLGFHLGNAVKYILRAGHKDDARQDIEKARWYLDRWLSTQDKEQSK